MTEDGGGRGENLLDVNQFTAQLGESTSSHFRCADTPSPGSPGRGSVSAAVFALLALVRARRAVCWARSLEICLGQHAAKFVEARQLAARCTVAWRGEMDAAADTLSPAPLFRFEARASGSASVLSLLLHLVGRRNTREAPANRAQQL